MAAQSMTGAAGSSRRATGRTPLRPRRRYSAALRAQPDAGIEPPSPQPSWAAGLELRHMKRPLFALALLAVCGFAISAGPALAQYGGGGGRGQGGGPSDEDAAKAKQ